MKKNIIFTRLTIFDNEFNLYDGVEELFSELTKEGHNLIVVTHKNDYKNKMERIIHGKLDIDIRLDFRKSVKEEIDEKNAKDYIIVGSSNEDLYFAAHKRVLIINPGWSIKQDDLPLRYAITLATPQKLLEAIRLIANQSKWYFNLDVRPNVKVLALVSANTMNRYVQETEKEILEGFKNLLKKGDRKYFNTLYFHLISGVMKDPELREVDIWGTFPSSGRGVANKEIEELKERCRYLTNKRMREPLFYRHISVNKSHETNTDERLKVGCEKHLESIILNDYYNSKRIKGKVVCVIDDYVTYGPSFETAKNLLLKAGASKVILLALGRYKKGNGIYQSEDYHITGEITKPGYNYERVNKVKLNGEYNDEARAEVNEIYRILNK